MWKVVLEGRRSLVGSAHRFLNAAREWSRPIRVAGHAIADVRKSKAELIAENALLRQQLIAAKRHLGRPLLAKPEKAAITLWARACQGWQSTLLLFQPDTIMRWHREMFRLVWWRKSRNKGNSMTKIDRATVGLIMDMARNNRTWGAERIRGALLKVGVVVAKRPIQQIHADGSEGHFAWWATVVDVS